MRATSASGACLCRSTRLVIPACRSSTSFRIPTRNYIWYLLYVGTVDAPAYRWVSILHFVIHTYI